MTPPAVGWRRRRRRPRGVCRWPTKPSASAGCQPAQDGARHRGGAEV